MTMIGCHIDKTFTIKRITHCRHPHWLAEHVCTAVRSGKNGTGEHWLVHNGKTPRPSSPVPRMNVTFFGDSLMGELHEVSRCTFLEPNVTLKREDVAVVPRNPENGSWLPRLLGRALSTSDIVIINSGLWYNWSPREMLSAPLEALIANVSEDWTDHALRGCAELKRQGFLGQAAASLDNRVIRSYAYARRSCPEGLGLRAYISDLKLLKRVAGEALANGRRPVLVWRTNTAQHYKTPGGLFDPAVLKMPRWPKAVGANRSDRCVPIQDEALARQRNILAERLLLDRPIQASGADHGERQQLSFRSTPRVFEHVLDTFESDRELYEQHSKRSADCSHFCLYSDATYHWLHALERLLCRVGSRFLRGPSYRQQAKQGRKQAGKQASRGSKQAAVDMPSGDNQ